MLYVMHFLFLEHSQDFLMANRTSKTQEQISKIQKISSAILHHC